MQLIKRPDPWMLPDGWPWTKIFWISVSLIEQGWPGDLAFKEAQTRFENHLLRLPMKPNANVLRAHRGAVGVKMVRVPDLMLLKTPDEKQIEKDRKDAELWAKSNKIKVYKMGSAVAI